MDGASATTRETLIHSRFPRHKDVPPVSVASSEEKMQAFGNRIFESRADHGQDGF
jgi:hypothetical protein